jgi:hypothetical protein
MSKNDIVGNRQSLLARSSTPLFLPFCVLLSLAGGVVTFLVFAIGLTIFDAALSRRADISEPVVLIVATLIGLLFPIIVLKRKREAARLHAANLPADAPTNDTRQLTNTRPNVTRLGDTVEAWAPANKDADASRTFQVSQDLPTEIQPRSSSESDIAGVTTIAPEAAPGNSDVAIKRRSPRPFFTVRRLLVSAGVFAVILLAIVFFGGGDLGLEVRSYGGNIVITNLKNEPSTPILDIVINNGTRAVHASSKSKSPLIEAQRRIRSRNSSARLPITPKLGAVTVIQCANCGTTSIRKFFEISPREIELIAQRSATTISV